MKITLKKINKSVFRKLDKIELRILNDLDFSFENGLFIIKGDNGAGKTTLLYILSLLDFSFQGTYLIDDLDIKTLQKDEIDEFKSKISLLFSKNNLLNFLTVEQTIKYFLGNHKKVDLNLKLPKKQLVCTLSGGEEILLALEIDLSLNKELFLLDEVTAMLDEEHFEKVMSVLTSISKNSIIILVSHDPRCFKYGKLLELKNGKLEECN